MTRKIQSKYNKTKTEPLMNITTGLPTPTRWPSSPVEAGPVDKKANELPLLR